MIMFCLGKLRSHKGYYGSRGDLIPHYNTLQTQKQEFDCIMAQGFPLSFQEKFITRIYRLIIKTEIQKTF